MFNFNSLTFKKRGLEPSNLSDEDLMSLLIGEPRFFKRPLVVINGQLHAGTNAKKLGLQLGFAVAN